jgi:integrase
MTRRAKKKRRPIRVFSFEQMHAFAKAAGRYEAMIRVFTDTGMRLGEVLPLRREDFDAEALKVRRTAHEGVILDGTKTDHGEHDAGTTVPVPATLAWMIEAQIQLNAEDCDLLFTTPTGRMWRERNFYHDLWHPTQEASGLDIRPRVPPLLRHPPPRRRHQRRRPSRDCGASRRDDAGAAYASGEGELYRSAHGCWLSEVTRSEGD